MVRWGVPLFLFGGGGRRRCGGGRPAGVLRRSPSPAAHRLCRLWRRPCRRVFLRLCVLLLLFRLPPCPPPVWRSRSSVSSPLPSRVRPAGACCLCALFGRFLFSSGGGGGLLACCVAPAFFFRVLLAPPFCGRFRGGSRVRRGGGPLRSCPCSMPRRPCCLLAPAPLRLPCPPAPLGCYLSVSVVVAVILSVDNFLCFLPHCQYKYLVIRKIVRIFVLNLKR